MSESKVRTRSRHATGMPAADRAMWIRLYEQVAVRNLPWTNQGPFPPLVRAVADKWLGSSTSVLDVGCGVGTNTFWLATQGFRATGIDIAPGAVAAAEARSASGSSNPDFVVGDILAGGLPAAGFNAGIDVGCFQTIPPRIRREYSISLARILSPGAPFLLFWVAREEEGSWGPPHRMSVREVVDSFESSFVVDRVEFRPRLKRLTAATRRTARPLATLAGYSARLVRRSAPQPPAR
jgi:SAM-dependent methyltransferase